MAAGVRLGPYEVLGLIGAGGMAEVYRARDTRLGREVAVKVVSETLGADDAFVERFEREARLVGSVNHPNVVALHDVGVHDGKPYFVTELLQGETLRVRLEKGGVPLPTALAWETQMAEGLAAAHERGIVHRDLKPENVLVTRDGHVKLLDFGIAKVIAAAQEIQPPDDAGPHDLLDETVASASNKTATGLVIGTPGYMSPEQLRGEPVDARTDLFSLGAMLYELVSGRRAFPGRAAVESGYAILHSEPEPLPGTVPPGVVQVIRRCLEKDPGRRFQSARDLAFRLEELRGQATGPSAAERGRRTPLVLAAAVLVLLAIAGGFWAARSGERVSELLRRRASGEPSHSVGTEATPSIAVLPFVNLSSDKEQEYFSDGITEELLDALARVKGLRVAGRTSSFHFKGKDEDVRTIGRALGVRNVVEGSVRRQGNRVRITAQLIQAADGFHLWSRTFEGDLSNVFDLQENVARAITDELKVVLKTDPGSRLVPVATSSPEAYSLYLQANAIFNRRENPRLVEGIEKLEHALRLDPRYARAWSRLATLRALEPIVRPAEFASAISESEKAADRAIELDPTLAEPHAALGFAFWRRRDLFASEAAFHRALELDPDDVTSNFWFGLLLFCEGYTRRASQHFDRVVQMEPLYSNGLAWRGNTAFAEGDVDMAERLLRQAWESGLKTSGTGLSYVAEVRGQRERAAVLLFESLTPVAQGLSVEALEAIARGAEGDAPARDRALALIDQYLATRPTVVSGLVPYALIRLGKPREGLEIVARGPTGNDAAAIPVLWDPHGREARKLPTFLEAARRIGLVDVWEKEGAPDLCERLAPGRYACR
ncbi:MAG TPA: protein kinase [Myxococcaceae bacterium]|nr:protein kinase [Myxococcaceae bacterium]